MASGWEFEYRVWRTWWDVDGYEDAHLYVTHQVGSARSYWKASADPHWMPRGATRGNVSPVLLFRRAIAPPQDGPSGHRLGWSAFGALEGTSDQRVGPWPDTTSWVDRETTQAALPAPAPITT